MKDLPRHIVGCVVMLIALLVLGAVFYVEIPAQNRDVAFLAVGIALGWAGNVVLFHFGSSEGSKSKTAMLSERPTGAPADPVATHEVDQ